MADGPLLVVLGGLPGSGKTSLARAAARQTGAVYLRIDTIERAIFESAIGGRPVEDAGYRVAYALASEHLALGHNVIADSVNPLPITRDAWTAVAGDTGSRLLQVEIVCSDATAHRHRIETRRAADPAAGFPEWATVQARAYAPWPQTDQVIDTAALSVERATDKLVRAMRRLSRPPG